MKGSYNEFAKYYDLLFQQKDYKKETTFILSILKKHNIKQNSLLDVGCGTGTHIQLLRKEFNTLYGIDISNEILKIAKRKVPESTFIQGNMQDFNIKKKFDVITCLYSVFNYNLDIPSAEKTLKNFHKHLKKDGIVIIGLYNERNEQKQFSLHVGKDSKTKVAKINEFKYHPEEKIEESSFLLLVKNQKNVDFDIEVEHKYRIFGFEEIDTLIKETGFKKYNIYHNFTFEKAEEDNTKFPVLIIQKRS